MLFQTSVMGRPIDRIVHPADHELIKKQFLLHRDVIALEPQSPNTSERSKGMVCFFFHIPV